MEEKPNYVKRTQKDYSLTLNIQIVKEVESGALSTLSAQRKYGIQSRSTVVTWLRKYGNFDWEHQTPSNIPKSSEQRILELEAKVKLLEKQKAQLERQNYVADQKAVIFDMMTDITEKEYNIDIRKNSSSGQSSSTPAKQKKV